MVNDRREEGKEGNWKGYEVGNKILERKRRDGIRARSRNSV